MSDDTFAGTATCRCGTVLADDLDRIDRYPINEVVTCSGCGSQFVINGSVTLFPPVGDPDAKASAWLRVGRV